LREKVYSLVLLLFLLFGFMVANFYLLQKELSSLYSLIIREEVDKVRSVVEGTISAGGDPVDALSYYIERSRLLKGATFYLEGREVVVPGSDISPSYHQVVVEVKPFKFRLFIDTSYFQEINLHIKLIFLSLIFFTALFLGALFYLLKGYYGEKLEAEKERQEKERIKSINLVIHSILHEVKNKLNVLNLLIHRFEKTKEDKYLNMLKRELQSINRYVEETADLRRPITLNPSTFTVGQLIEELNGRLGELLKSSGVSFELSYDDCKIEADYERLLSALTDLVKNAVEALEGKSKKVIKLEGKCDGDLYIFKVYDSGGYLPKELFRPFRSGKKGGFGLGLFNVMRTAKAHGGDISAYVSNGWTIFELKIPTKSSEIPPKNGA